MTYKHAETTAQLREGAQEAEKQRLWNSAAYLWEKAIAAYPNPAGNLAKADIARMKERAAACKHQLSVYLDKLGCG